MKKDVMLACVLSVNEMSWIFARTYSKFLCSFSPSWLVTRFSFILSSTTLRLPLVIVSGHFSSSPAIRSSSRSPVTNSMQLLYSEKLSREKRILAFFAKVYLAKVFKMAIRESLSSEIFLKHQFAKVYPVKFVKQIFYFFLFICKT